MKCLLMVCLFMLGLVGVANAGVLQDVVGAVSGVLGDSMSVVIGAVVSGVLLIAGRLIPDSFLIAFFGGAGEKLGKMITFGMAKWKWSAPFWNSKIEPWLINVIKNTVVEFINGMFRGMKSDNS